MDPADIRLAGAVPLGATTAPTSGPAKPGVIDVTEATFQAEVLERSRTAPVVLDFWASWCGPCRQLSPVLEKLAGEAKGAWTLAKIDVDANPRLAQAAAVQGIPAVKGVVAGQLVSEFTGALPEAQVREWVQELVAAAEQITGAAADGAAAAADPESTEPAPEPELVAAAQALARNDLDGAGAAYAEMLVRLPDDPDATLGLARVHLMQRAVRLDERAARKEAAERPDDVAAQAAAADIDMLGGHVEDAITRLVDLVRRSSGDERDAARTHLITLFAALHREDPRLAAGRRALSNALF